MFSYRQQLIDPKYTPSYAPVLDMLTANCLSLDRWAYCEHHPVKGRSDHPSSPSSSSLMSCVIRGLSLWDVDDVFVVVLLPRFMIILKHRHRE